MNGSKINSEIGKWFKENRELYEWPPSATRKISQERIINLCAGIQTAVAEGDRDALRSLLVEIHQWKTGNQQNVTLKYCSALEFEGLNYLDKLLGFGPFLNNQNLEDTIKHLKIDYCNLPVCTAIASFLYGRRNIPIIDIYLAQFFSRKFNNYSIDSPTGQVLSYLKKINFRIEDGGKGKPRLAVYTLGGFTFNLNAYLHEFVPECNRISNELKESGFVYIDICGQCVEFLSIDVEMAIFAWARKHRNLF